MFEIDHSLKKEWEMLKLEIENHKDNKVIPHYFIVIKENKEYIDYISGLEKFFVLEAVSGFIKYKPLTQEVINYWRKYPIRMPALKATELMGLSMTMDHIYIQSSLPMLEQKFVLIHEVIGQLKNEKYHEDWEIDMHALEALRYLGKEQKNAKAMQIYQAGLNLMARELKQSKGNAKEVYCHYPPFKEFYDKGGDLQ